VRSGQKKWPEIVILTILSPVRLPFRHTGYLYLQVFIRFLPAAKTVCAAICAAVIA
jgi:hypothetical protein